MYLKLFEAYDLSFSVLNNINFFTPSIPDYNNCKKNKFFFTLPPFINAKLDMAPLGAGESQRIT